MVTKALKKTPHRVKKNKLEYGIFVNQILQWSICPKSGRRMRGGWVSDSLLSNIWPGIPGCWGDPGFPPPPDTYRISGSVPFSVTGNVKNPGEIRGK